MENTADPRPEDGIIIAQVTKALIDISMLAPYMLRLKEIVEDVDHPLFTSYMSKEAPEMRTHMSLMRRAQVGALIQVLRVMQKTTLDTMQALPKLENDAKKRVLDEAMGRIGLSDSDKGQDVP